jgi:hypothetical protein
MLNIYDREGNEVFQEEGKGLIKSADDPNVRHVIESQREVETMLPGETADGIFTRLEPLLNERECQQCHGINHAVRGVTWVSLKPDLMSLHAQNSPAELSRIQSEVGEIVCTALTASFRNIMVSGEGPLMDCAAVYRMRASV